MPLNPKALADLIEAQIKLIPIGVFPVSTQLTSTPAPDGTASVAAVPTPAPVFMDPAIAKVIATAVATAVCTHLLSASLIIGPGNMGAPVVSKLT